MIVRPRVVMALDVPTSTGITCVQVWNDLGKTSLEHWTTEKPIRGRNEPWIWINWGEPLLLLQSLAQLIYQFISSRFSCLLPRPRGRAHSRK